MSTQARKYWIKSISLPKDVAISLAGIVDNTTAQVNHDLKEIFREKRPEEIPKIPIYKPKFRVEGGTIEVDFDSLESLKSETWPSDSKRIIFSSPETEILKMVSIDIASEKGGAAIIRGDDNWAMATSKKIEEIVRPHRRLQIDLLHRREASYLISFLLSFLLTSYGGYLLNPPHFWWMFTDVGLLIFGLMVTLVVTVFLAEPLSQALHFMYPYVDFGWNDWRLRNGLRAIIGFIVIGLILSGLLWDYLSKIIFSKK